MGFRKLSMAELGRIEPESYAIAPKRPWVLLLDNVRSLHNVGAMFRTADAFALEGMALCGFTGTPPRRELHAAALGAELVVPWVHYDEVTLALEHYRQEGYQIVALEQCEGSTNLNDIPACNEQKMVLVVGNEVKGVQEEALALCDTCIEIPQYGTKHSLNVATAAGIALWSLGGGIAPQTASL